MKIGKIKQSQAFLCKMHWSWLALIILVYTCVFLLQANFRERSKKIYYKNLYEDIYFLTVQAALLDAYDIRNEKHRNALIRSEKLIADAPKTLCSEMKDYPGVEYWLSDLKTYITTYGVVVDEAAKECLSKAAHPENPKAQRFHNFHYLGE